MPVGSYGALTRGQSIIGVSLLAIAALAWIDLAHLATGMAEMGSAATAMPDMTVAAVAPHPGWAAVDFMLTASMWVVMMVGMMLPSAVPMILFFTAVAQKGEAGAPYLDVTAFVLGYLAVWLGFAISASIAQGLLARAALLTADLGLSGAWLGGMVFLAAGAYEFSPLKNRCLDLCRAPFSFFAIHWQSGRLGALRMGAIHGAFCLGCCWVVMLLLFVGGVMNLIWVAVLTALVLLQKIIPGRGAIVSYSTGGVLIALGIALVAHGVL